jgi:hypothetical protein
MSTNFITFSKKVRFLSLTLALTYWRESGEWRGDEKAYQKENQFF